MFQQYNIYKLKILYQGRATRIDQEVEDSEELVLPDQDQGGADGLQNPVDHVESHRDQIPCPPCFPSGDAETRGLSVLVLSEPKHTDAMGKKQDAVFKGSDCIDYYFDALSSL